MPTSKSRQWISQFYSYKGGGKPKNFLGVKSLNWMDPLNTMHGGGGKGPQKANAPQVTSTLNGLNETDFNTPFGTNSTTKTYDPKTNTTKIATNSSLTPELQSASNAASTGLANNLSYIGADPTAQFGRMTTGQDPIYNALEHQRQVQMDTDAGNLAVQAQGTGNLNSTAYGSSLGYLKNQGNINQNNNLLSALTYGNQLANTNAATQQNALTTLAGLSYGPASASNSNMMTGLAQLDNVSLANAGHQFDANKFNAETQNAYNTQQQANKGNMIGSAIAIGAAPFTGGASLAALPALQSLAGGSGSGGSFNMPSSGLSGNSGAAASGITPTFQSIPRTNFNYTSTGQPMASFGAI